MIIGSTTQVFPPRWWCGQAARGVAHSVVLGVSKCLPPCPGKAKLILKTNKSSPGLPPVPLCYPPAAGSECCWSWGGRWLWWGSSPLLTPQCRVGARLHQGSLPLTSSYLFQSFSKATIPCNAFGVGIPPVFFGLFFLQAASPARSECGCWCCRPPVSSCVKCGYQQVKKFGCAGKDVKAERVG